MYGSKCMNDLDDDYPCEEIIISREVLYPEPLSRKKIKKEKFHQKCIEDFAPCCLYSDSQEDVQSVKPREKDFKLSSTLRDTKQEKSTKKRTSRKRNETYDIEDECSDPHCSIIYSNPFDEDDQMADEFQPHLGCCLSNAMAKVDWIESNTNMCMFPVKEEPKGSTSTCSIQKTSDFRDNTLKELLPDIPSIPQYNLPDTVEVKPEPEVLATALLMSEHEDLESTRPVEIFDKLFSESAAQETIPMAKPSLERTGKTGAIDLPTGISPVMDTDNTDPTMEENTMGETSASVIIESQINETKERPSTIDVTSLPSEWKKNSREERMEDNGMLKYVMKAEAAASPAYRNYVRLNGSVKPSWFAGYSLVSPLLPDCVRITSDPGEALLEAWRLCRPRHFDEFCKSFLNTA